MLTALKICHVVTLSIGTLDCTEKVHRNRYKKICHILEYFNLA